MTFYYNDRDFTFVQEDDGKIYFWGLDGKGPLTDIVHPDLMTWHECSEKYATEIAGIKEKELAVLRKRS